MKIRISLPAALAAAALLTCIGSAVRAQIRLPPINVPTVPSIGTVARDASSSAAGLAASALSDVRRLTVLRLFGANRRVLDRDRAGNLIVRDELLAFTTPDRANGLALPPDVRVLRREAIPSVDLELLVLSVPAHRSIHRLLKELRKTDATTVFDYNHIYLGVGDQSQPGARSAVTATPGPAPATATVGMIDTGVDASHPALRDAVVVSWGCEAPAPAAHGTAVASLIAGDDGGFHGAAPRAKLFAADVFCGRPTGGAVDALAGAFGWLLERAVPVVNVSLVGPRNAALELIVARVQAAGQLVVAAVGNDGPAAPPLYPAAYPGVVGVTGVDAKRRVLLEANRGPQVRFSAPGADLLAAKLGGGYESVRGTSYAAPIVAGLLAAKCIEPDPECGARAVAALSSEAVRMGHRESDTTYGVGVVGEAVRALPRK